MRVWTNSLVYKQFTWYNSTMQAKLDTSKTEVIHDQPVDRDPSEVERAKSWFQNMPEPWRAQYEKLKARREVGR